MDIFNNPGQTYQSKPKQFGVKIDPSNKLVIILNLSLSPIALQKFEIWILKIQDGCHIHTCESKLTQFGVFEILVSTPFFRHFKHQILFTSDNFIHNSGIIYLVPFLATYEAVALPTNDPIMSER